MSKDKDEVSSKDIRASVKYVKVSPYKARKVANTIRRLSPKDAIERLKLMPQKSAKILGDLVRSCVANANHNFSITLNDLEIVKLLVNEGPKHKRSRARARGRIFGILKPTSHIIVVMRNKTQGV